jgi:hypothetical protein
MVGPALFLLQDRRKESKREIESGEFTWNDRDILSSCIPSRLLDIKAIRRDVDIENSFRVSTRMFKENSKRIGIYSYSFFQE